MAMATVTADAGNFQKHSYQDFHICSLSLLTGETLSIECCNVVSQILLRVLNVLNDLLECICGVLNLNEILEARSRRETLATISRDGFQTT